MSSGNDSIRLTDDSITVAFFIFETKDSQSDSNGSVDSDYINTPDDQQTQLRISLATFLLDIIEISELDKSSLHYSCICQRVLDQFCMQSITGYVESDSLNSPLLEKLAELVLRVLAVIQRLKISQLVEFVNKNVLDCLNEQLSYSFPDEETKNLIFYLNMLYKIVDHVGVPVIKQDTIKILFSILDEYGLCATTADLLNILQHPRVVSPHILAELYNYAFNFCRKGDVKSRQSGYTLLCRLWKSYYLEKLSDLQFDAILKLMTEGLMCRDDPLIRKTSLHLLRQTVIMFGEAHGSENQLLSNGDFCSVMGDFRLGFTDLWLDFFTVYEALEEKQVHLITPVLPNFTSLCESANQLSFHSTWVLILFQRLFEHDNRNLAKWAITFFLNLDLNSFPIFQQGNGEFVFGKLIVTLEDCNIFTRNPNAKDAEPPVIFEALQSFIDVCASHSELNRDIFLQQLLTAVCRNVNSVVPSVYILRALNLASIQGNMEDGQTLSDIRLFFSVVSRSPYVFLRNCSLKFLAAFTLRHSSCVDESEVPFIYTFIHTCMSWIDIAWPEVFAKAESLTSQSRKSWDKFAWKQLDKIGGLDDAEIKCLAVWTLLVSSLHPPSSTTDWSKPFSFDIFAKALLTPLHNCKERAYVNTELANSHLRLLVEIRDFATSHVFADKSFARRLTEIVWECSEDLLDYVYVQTLEDLDEGVWANIPLFCSLLKILISGNTAKEREINGGVKLTVIIRKLYAVCLKLMDPTCFEDENKFSLAPTAILVFVLENYKQNVDLKLLQELLSKWIFQQRLPYASKVNLGLSQSHTSNLWKLIEFHVRGGEVANCSFLRDCGLQAFELNLLEGNAALYNTLDLLHCQDFDSSIEERLADTRNLLRMAYNAVTENKRNSFYWEYFRGFARIAFGNLMHNCIFVDLLIQYFNRIYEEADSSPKLFRLFFEHISGVWCDNGFELFDREEQIRNLNVDILSTALIFGTIHQKDQRLYRDATKYMAGLRLDNLCHEAVQESDYQDHLRIRVSALKCFLDLGSERSDVVQLVLGALARKEDEITRKLPKYHRNTLVHRVKTRVWQCFVVAVRYFKLTDVCKELIWHRALSVLTEECLQPSIRLLIVWTMVQLTASDQKLYNRLFTDCQQAIKKRHSSIAAFSMLFAGLGTEVCKGFRENYDDVYGNFADRALVQIGPWCVGHQFSNRIYSKMAFIHIWRTFNNGGYDAAVRAHGAMFAAISERAELKDSKLTAKLHDEVFMVNLETNNCSIEFIFCDAPRLTQVNNEDWITPDLLKEAFPPCLERRYAQNIFISDRRFLETLNAWVESGGNCEPILPMYVNTLTPAKTSSPAKSMNVQKKIVPNQSLQRINEIEEISRERMVMRDKGCSLIIVASLIDKSANLGGLCRSCEVFGIDELVVDNSKVTDDAVFKGLSMTSEKWVDITEVKPSCLPNYIREQRTRGYAIVGLEQTANSAKLDHFDFPERCVVVLGSEKQGIPVELIQLVDVCVEIPQQGLIRSLNVHVSGALLMWEFAKQHCTRTT